MSFTGDSRMSFSTAVSVYHSCYNQNPSMASFQRCYLSGKVQLSLYPFVRRVSCSTYAHHHQPARKASLHRCEFSTLSLFSSFQGANSRGIVVCKFEEDDKKPSVCETSDTDEERPPFNINIAVVLAGFAFEAYNTPSDKGRTHETDPFDCKTVFLSEHFLREVYDGKLFVNLKRGSKFPGLDLWGTSDPYVVMRVGECVVRSKTIWATTEPVWNEQFKINVKNPSSQYLQVAVWDANLVIEHRRLGNSGVNLESLSDGEKHEVEVELEGMGGGGIITMEVQYKRFEEIDVSGRGWTIPLLSEFLQGKGLEDVIKSAFGNNESVTVRDFLTSVLSTSFKQVSKDSGHNNGVQEGAVTADLQADRKQNGQNDVKHNGKNNVAASGNDSTSEQQSVAKHVNGEDEQALLDSGSTDERNIQCYEMDFLKALGERVSQTLGVNVEKLGISVLDNVNWDALDVIKNLGLEFKSKANSEYVQKGLAVEETYESSSPRDLAPAESSPASLEEVKKASVSLLKQTEETLKSWAVLATSLTSQAKIDEGMSDTMMAIVKETKPSADEASTLVSVLGDKLRSSEELEELRKMFCKAESAMEAWAVLASSLGHKSFVKSAFEKLCFLDNNKTDTQVSLWRDTQHRRLVVAFRGTEQVKWKDLRTDLMILPVSFNPERVGGEFKEEAQIHGGFLSAYDSVRNKLMSLVKAALGSSSETAHNGEPWHVYVTGHSLGGALATLFALEFSTSQLSKRGHIKVSMYNFGSPRVGNRKFADRYNEIVKDSWRIVNHRDIIPTVPRLMGYCHVARAIYLTAGEVYDATVNMDLIEDGYQGDVIGEATPDFILEEFMKGEKRLIERLLQTEIAMIRAIRDGSALMQHMEDFYYISLLESVSPGLRIVQTDSEQGTTSQPSEI